MSAHYGNLEIVEYLVKNGANINSQFFDLPTESIDALTASIKNGHIDVVKFLIKNGANIYVPENCALSTATACGHLNIVKYLIGYGVDIHADGDAATKLSGINGYVDIFKYMISKFDPELTYEIDFSYPQLEPHPSVLSIIKEFKENSRKTILKSRQEII